MVKVTAKVVGITQPILSGVETPEGLIAYCARVSNPKNQFNEDYKGLLDYCIRNKHHSVFEMGNAIVEVEAPRDISRQLLRHRSFSFQEFSQRYSDEIEFTERDFRRQDLKNRQNSIDDFAEAQKLEYTNSGNEAREMMGNLYQWLRDEGVAKECARVVLPEGLVMSRLYVNGTIRSWLHYLDVRDDEGVTQWEHVLLAREIRKALQPHFPAILGGSDGKAV